jgi:hypothetical protein
VQAPDVHILSGVVGNADHSFCIFPILRVQQSLFAAMLVIVLFKSCVYIQARLKKFFRIFLTVKKNCVSGSVFYIFFIHFHPCLSPEWRIIIESYNAQSSLNYGRNENEERGVFAG